MGVVNAVCYCVMFDSYANYQEGQLCKSVDTMFERGALYMML